MAPTIEVWEKVVRKLRTGMMPPIGMPRPDAATMTAFTTALEGQLDAANPPGRHLDTPAFQRLNRTEYANAVRDLLAVDVDVRALLPGDDSSEGFDNIAEALTVSPSLVQGYVAAALKISRRAIGDRTAAPSQITYSAPGQWVHAKHVEGLPLGTRGGMLVSHTFPLDAEYELSIAGGGPGGLGGSTIDITLDGQPLMVANPRTFRQRITAGPHTIGLALVDRARGAGVDDTFSDHRTDAAFATPGGVQTLTILGPFDASGIGETPSRTRIFICRPATAAEEPACARRIVSGLARRAYRRPTTAAEIDTLMTFYRQGRDEGDFEVGLQHALARILVAPAFLFRTEEPPAGSAPGTVYAISDLALASRLSFFLWSSIPDDQLLDLAVAGRLKNPAVLEKQVRRMLADPKAGCAGRELRRPVAVPARPRHGADGSQELRRQPAPVVQARDRDAVRQHRPRGPQPAGAAGRRLHVRGRAAGAPLRHPQRLRQPLPPRHAGPEQPAPRHPGPGQHADGDVGGDADLAGDARQVGAREPARRAAARAAAGRRGEPGSRRLVRHRPRCASAWSCTAPTRCARRATR